MRIANNIHHNDKYIFELALVSRTVEAHSFMSDFKHELSMKMNTIAAKLIEDLEFSELIEKHRKSKG